MHSNEQRTARTLFKKDSVHFHFRSLDDILGFGRAEGGDRVGAFASQLAKDVLAASSVFTEHRPLQLMTSVDSWISVSSQGPNSIAIVDATQERTRRSSEQEEVRRSLSIQEKRRLYSQHNRSVPALLSVDLTPAALSARYGEAQPARSADVTAMTHGEQGVGPANGSVQPVSEAVGEPLSRVISGYCPGIVEVASSDLQQHGETNDAIFVLPKINERKHSLPSHNSSVLTVNTKHVLTVRKSSSFKYERRPEATKLRANRWSASIDQVQSCGIRFDQSLMVGARYASETSMGEQPTEVSPTALQLLRSELHVDESMPPIAATGGKRGRHRRGKRAAKKNKQRSRRDGVETIEKKKSVLSRFWGRLFSPNKRDTGFLVHDPTVANATIRQQQQQQQQQQQEEDGNSGRVNFPSVRKRPAARSRYKSNENRHRVAAPKLSRISSCPSLVVLESSPPLCVSYAGGTRDLSASFNAAQTEKSVDLDLRHSPVTAHSPHLKPSQLSRKSSWRESVRQRMKRIKNLTVKRKRPNRTRSRSPEVDSVGLGSEHSDGVTGPDGQAVYDIQSLTTEDDAATEFPFSKGMHGEQGQQFGEGDDKLSVISGFSRSSQSTDDGAGAAAASGGGADRSQYKMMTNSSSAPTMAVIAVDGKSFPRDSHCHYGRASGEQWDRLSPTEGDKAENQDDYWPHLSPSASRKRGSAPMVRIINPPTEEAALLSENGQSAVVTRNLAPEKRQLRRERSKSLEPSSFDAKRPPGYAPVRSKGIPTSPSWSTSLERGQTLAAGDKSRLLIDGAPGNVRRSLSQRATGFHAVGVAALAVSSINTLSPESRSNSHSWTTLFKGRRPSQPMVLGEQSKQTSASTLMLPGSSLRGDSFSKSLQQLNTIMGIDDQQGSCDAEHAAPPATTLHPPNKPKAEMQQDDYRQHVVLTLLDTERSYLLSLQTLCKDYLYPLRSMNNIDQQLVADIFDDIPLITLHHNQLYHELKECADTWSNEKTIGDILNKAFSFGQLGEAYESYVVKYERSQESLRAALASRPFLKFIESRSKENEGKQNLSDLLVKPVQRIPRYSLIIKDLLKHTGTEHADHGLLLTAFAEVGELAEKLDQGVKHADQLDDLRKIEQCFQGALPGLVSADRHLERRDRVSELMTKSGHKDRWLFLFNDQLVCATMRRRTGNRKPMAMAMQSGTLTDPDVVRYKLIWRAPLQDVNVIQTSHDKLLEKRSAETLQRLQGDLNTLSQMNSLCSSLSLARQPTTPAVNNLQTSIGAVLKEINEQIDQQKHNRDAATLQLAVESKFSQGLDDHALAFLTVKDKTDWIAIFTECKEAVVAALGGASAWCTKLSGDDSAVPPVVRLPAFLAALPVLKTRSGMQITCSSSSVAPRCLTPYAMDAKANGQLWICTSDGHVGQVCMVSMEKTQPALSACIAVTDAQITTIVAVPEYIPASISESLARTKMLSERENSTLASDSEFEVVSDAGLETESVTGDEMSLRASVDDATSRILARPEKKLSRQQLTLLRTKLSHALLLTYRNRLRLPSMVVEEKEESDLERLSRLGERSNALSVLSNVSLKALGDEPLGTEDLESLYSSASLLRVLSATPGVFDDDDMENTEYLDEPPETPAKRLLSQSLSDGILLDSNRQYRHPLLARTESYLPPSDKGDLEEIRELLMQVHGGNGASTPILHQQSHASLTHLLEGPLSPTGSHDWSQPEPGDHDSSGVSEMLQRKSLSDCEDAGVVDKDLKPKAGSPSDKDDLTLPGSRDIDHVHIMAKSQRPLTRRVSAPADSPVKKTRSLSEDGFDGIGGKRLTHAVQSLLKPSIKVKKMPLRPMKSGSASSDADQSPVRYVNHQSTPGNSELADDESSNSPMPSSAGRSFSASGERRSLLPSATVCRSESDASRHSSDAVAVRSKTSGISHKQRSRKFRSQSLPQVIISTQTSVSSSGMSNGSAEAEGEAQTDHEPSVWLATNNAQLCIYRAGDSIRMRQRRTVLKLSSNVKAMCYLDGCVFVSLEGGQLLLFSRNLNGNWDTSSADFLHVGDDDDVVTCMAVVEKELWCGVNNSVHVVHPVLPEVKASFVVTKSADSGMHVTDMVCNENAVYIATYTSSIISVFHATSYRRLAEVNLLPCVQQLLKGCDPIIRQHKIRCLRVTVMHSYRSIVWVGTSAGLVLSIPALHVSKDNSGGEEVVQQQCYGSYHGHTGPVRFITTVERPLTSGGSQTNRDGSNTSTGKTTDGSADSQPTAPPAAAPPATLLSLVSNTVKSTTYLVDHNSIQRAVKPATRPLPSAGPGMLTAEHYRPLTRIEAMVVAGGDGCEDFHVSSVLENDDGAYENGGSHILMWQVD